MMHCIIDSLNGNLSAKIFWNVNSPPSPNARDVKRSLHGPVTLEWINMYPGTIQRRYEPRNNMGEVSRLLQTAIQ